MVAKVLIGSVLAIVGAVVIGVTLGFLVGPIDTGNSNANEAINGIGSTLFSQAEESEANLENETDNEADSESENGIRNIVRSRIANITTNDSDNSENSEGEAPEDEPEPEEPPPPHPIVGIWETTSLVEIDIEATGSIPETTRFFEDGTGIEFHSESPQMRDFTWRIDNNRLIITPADTSQRISTYNFELTRSTLTIFYNTNRTSYSEATRIRN